MRNSPTLRHAAKRMIPINIHDNSEACMIMVVVSTIIHKCEIILKHNVNIFCDMLEIICNKAYSLVKSSNVQHSTYNQTHNTNVFVVWSNISYDDPILKSPKYKFNNNV